MSLEGIITGIGCSLIAAALDRYCLATYRYGLVELVYLKAIEIWNWGIKQARVAASLLTRVAQYIKEQVGAGIVATRDWIAFVTQFSSRLVRVAIMTAIVIAIALIPPFLQKTYKNTSPQFAENMLPERRFIAKHKLEQLDPGPGEWTYRGARSEDRETRLEIFHNGQRAFSYSGYYTDFITFSDQAEDGYPSFFVEGAGEIQTKDITGDRVPDVMIVENCGCSAGTSTYTLLSLGEEVKETFTTEDWLGEGAWGLEDVDDDGVYEAIGPDFPIMVRDQGYKWAGPSINVILKYKDGNFVYASDLMRREPPTRSEFLAQVERAKQDLGDYKIPDFGSYYTDGLPDSVSEYAINLIYTGNGELAHEFINMVFSDEEEEERDYLWRSLYTDLSGQSYWPQLAAMNHWTEDQYILGDMC